MNDIHRFLSNSNKENILEELSDRIRTYTQKCAEMLGEGFFGKVYIPDVGPTVKILVKDIELNMDVVVKEAKHKDGVFGITEKNNIMYIFSSREMTAESLMNCIISKFWYDSKIPNVPFLVSSHRCGHSEYMEIDKLVFERQGLKDLISYGVKGFDPMLLTSDMEPINKSYMETYEQLITYCLNGLDDSLKCKLPNGVIVYFPSLIDSLFIQFLYTSDYLYRHVGLILTDQHMGNIFIHWIDQDSHIGKRNVSGVDTICYELDNGKYISVETFGILLKIGDIGTSIMHIQPDVYIVGDVINPDKLDNIDKLKQGYCSYLDMILNITIPLPVCIKEKLKIYNIIKSSQLSKHNYITKPDIEKMPSVVDIFSMPEYSDMIIDSCKNENTFIVKH